MCSTKKENLTEKRAASRCPTYEICGAKDGKDFVGLKFEENKLRVCFPMGYNLSASSLSEKEKRKAVLNLISVLSTYGEKSEGFYNQESPLTEENRFPIHAYLYLVAEYLNHGYYTESEISYKPSKAGKINWTRTIKHRKPNISENGIYYSDFITRKTNHCENDLITEIHKFCVYESFMKIGFMFCSFLPEKPAIEFNAEFFKSIILSKITETFNEKVLILFRQMLAVIDFLNCEKDAKIQSYGTTCFYTIWEKIIDKIFGTVSDKSKYFPHGLWKIGPKVYDDSPLIPDTIMESDLKIFVLDSKYYKYGITANANDLPPTSSILKQIAYAEFIETCNNFQYDGKDIFNVFIMPYAANANEEDTKNSNLKLIGYSESNWKKPNEKQSYLKIYGILLDTKWIMEQGLINRENHIKELAKLILKQN